MHGGHWLVVSLRSSSLLLLRPPCVYVCVCFSQPNSPTYTPNSCLVDYSFTSRTCTHARRVSRDVVGAQSPRGAAAYCQPLSTCVNINDEQRQW